MLNNLDVYRYISKMSEKEKKKTTAKTNDKPATTKQVDGSQNKSSGKEAGGV